MVQEKGSPLYDYAADAGRRWAESNPGASVSNMVAEVLRRRRRMPDDMTGEQRAEWENGFWEGARAVLFPKE